MRDRNVCPGLAGLLEAVQTPSPNGAGLAVPLARADATEAPTFPHWAAFGSSCRVTRVSPLMLGPPLVAEPSETTVELPLL